MQFKKCPKQGIFCYFIYKKKKGCSWIPANYQRLRLLRVGIGLKQRLHGGVNGMQWKWEKVLNAIHNDIVIANKQGIIVYVNEATEKLYSRLNVDFIGKTVEDMEHKKIFNPSVTKKVLSSGKKETLIQETKTGNKVLVTGNPIFDEVGEIEYVVSYSHDVTELFKLKEHVGKMEMEMEVVKGELSKLRNRQSATEETFSSHAMNKIFETIKKIAVVDVSVLLTGESGVGKTLLARKLHQRSHRSKAPFIEINCGSIPENLLESELFGFEPGAFTGAQKQGKKGLVEQAEGGTLFLDEIGEIPLHLQVKLLTLIQDKAFYRVGGTIARKVDFRLVAATNADLKTKVESGEFRRDLFFRLSVFPIHIPPLRERPEDTISLILTFIDKFNQLYDKNKKFNQRAIDILLRYSWPGNVRELENLVQRMVLTVDEDVIGPKDLPESVIGINAALPIDITLHKSLPESLKELEATLVQIAYRECESTTQMAKVLGISQPTVVRKLKKYKPLFKIK
jgi:PAS domain S-box-containing protein